MANEYDARIIQDFAYDARRLDQAAIGARTADRLGKQRLSERTFQSLLHIEPLVYKTSILLDATAVVRRSDRERGIDPD